MGMDKYADITPFYEWLDWLEKESNTPYPEYQTMMFYEIRDKLDALPEVVRCKDCKYGIWDDEEAMRKCVYSAEFDEDISEWLGFYEYNDGNHFCSYGERKDNAKL